MDSSISLQMRCKLQIKLTFRAFNERLHFDVFYICLLTTNERKDSNYEDCKQFARDGYQVLNSPIERQT